MTIIEKCYIKTTEITISIQLSSLSKQDIQLVRVAKNILFMPVSI